MKESAPKPSSKRARIEKPVSGVILIEKTGGKSLTKKI